MFQTSPLADLRTYAVYFPGPHLAMVIDAAIVGNTDAEFWLLPQMADDPALLLWDQGNEVFYLAGNLNTDTAQPALTRLFAEEIRPRALARGANYCKVQLLSDAPDIALHVIFPWGDLSTSDSCFYRFEAALPSIVPQPAVEGIQFVPIGRMLLVNDRLENSQHIRNEVAWMWPSLAHYERNGFGVAAVVGNEAICWCTAEYVGPTSCGIGIATIPSYEGKGIATATAARFVQLCQQRGITPHWECDQRNIASVRVAEKVGFTKIANERYWSGTLTS